MITIPTFIFGALIALLYGAFFHLLVGGSLGILMVYLFASFLGFWLGNYFGNQLQISIITLGPLNLGLGLIGSTLICLVAWWLSKESQPVKENKE